MIQMTDVKSKEKSISKIYFLAVVILTLLLLNVAIVVVLTWPITEFSIAKAGAFGDTFGWLNAAFSGFAFLGVAWTLALQSEELKESRTAAKLDRFEASFFRILELLRKNLEEIRIATPDGGQPVYGVEALTHCWRRVQERMKEHEKWLLTPNGRNIYEQLLHKATRNLPTQARYLGTLETLLELIERDMSTPQARTPYWDILAQQLTSGEAKYLLFLGLRGKQPDKLSCLISQSEPLLARMAALSVTGPQRALYKRLYGVDLNAPAATYPPIFSSSAYRSIRKMARRELQERTSATRGHGQ